MRIARQYSKASDRDLDAEGSHPEQAVALARLDPFHLEASPVQPFGQRIRPKVFLDYQPRLAVGFESVQPELE